MTSVASRLRLLRKVVCKRDAMPEVVTLFATHRCNADCSFCFFADSLNVPVPELTVDEWRRVAESMQPFSLLILTGGEPFARKELAEIAIAFIARAGVDHLSVPTNGSMPDRIEAFVDTVLAQSDVRSLCVSLSVDAIGTAHDNLRRMPGLFAKLHASAQRLAQLRERYRGRLLLHTATVYSALNQAEVEATLAYIESEFRPDSMGLTLVRTPFCGPHHEGLDVERYRRLNRALARRSVSRRYSLVGARLHRAKTNRVVREAVQGHFVSPCFAGQINAVIYADGRVPLCERRSEELGSLRDFGFDFQRLWRSPAARAAVVRQQAERCRCGHECFVTPNIAFAPGQLLRALVAP